MENIVLCCAAVITTATALFTVKTLSLWIEAPKSFGRYETIDGLRGFLGFFVFIHHANFWKSYATTGVWQPTQSTLFTLLGSASVKLFFMITGFLFFTKLLNDRGKGTDYVGLLTSRILRLSPLYFAVIGLMLGVIFIKTGGQLNESLQHLGKGILQWLTFTLPGSPDLNGFHPTSAIMSGVYWTLPYEWVFYMSLPILAIFTGERPKYYFVIISVLFLFVFASFKAEYLSFLGGIIASIAVRNEKLREFARRPTSSYLIIALLIAHAAMLRLKFTAPFSELPLGAAFLLIAGGNSIFGCLTHKLSRSMGEFTYGIYLIHGILLFIIFEFFIPSSTVAAWSLAQYWTAIVLITPIVILLSAGSYIFIEKPAINKTKVVSNFLKFGRASHQVETAASGVAANLSRGVASLAQVKQKSTK